MNIDWLLELDRQVLAFFNGSDSLFLDAVAMTFTSGLTWIPLYLALFYILIKNNENMTQIFLIVMSCLVCLFFTYGLADFIAKPYVARWRPTNDPIIKYTIDVVNNYRETPYGFFSAHAANTFSIALFFVLLVRSRLLTTVLIAWSLLNCWTRMYLGVHYLGDVTVGFFIGNTIGCVSYYLMNMAKKKMNIVQNKFISMQFTSTSYLKSDMDMFLAVVFLNYMLVIIISMILGID